MTLAQLQALVANRENWDVVALARQALRAHATMKETAARMAARTEENLRLVEEGREPFNAVVDVAAEHNAALVEFVTLCRALTVMHDAGEG